MSDRDTKRSSIIVGSGPGGSFKEGDDVPRTDADAPKVGDGSPKPITLEAMARYLRELTSHPDGSRPNNYIRSDSVSVIRTHDNDGYPTAIISPSPTDGTSFAPDGTNGTIIEIARATFDSETLQRIHDPRTNTDTLLRDIVGKTQHTGRGAQVVDDPTKQSPIERDVSAVLRRNRFNPTPGTSPFSFNQAQSNVDQRPVGVSQTSFGEYNATPATGATGITYEQMKKIGLALMLRSTGQVIGANNDPTGAGAQLGSLVPSPAQLGVVRVDRKSMWASDLAVEQGKPPGIGDRTSNVSSDLIMDGSDELLNGSFGSLNSFLEPFGGLAPVGMAALAAALVIAVKLLATLVTASLNAVSPPSIASTDAQAPDPSALPRVPGTSKNEASATSAITTLVFGLTQTQHPFNSAFSRGIDVFFEFNGTSFSRVLTAPGYYAVMIRSIIRSGNAISKSIADVFSGGGIVAGVQAVLGLADVIKSSKIISFSNVIANLGDRILTLEDEGLLASFSNGQQAQPGNLPNSGKISTIDRLDATNPATHNMKSRIRETSLALAWGTSTTPSAYLLPTTVLKASLFLTDGGSGVVDMAYNDRPKSISGLTAAKDRLDGSIVKQLEDQLDSEYVPFYFHDLRTNEIVSFHAFLASISENFNANYESSNYYGRVDPVRIYSHTERVINMSFHIVSTNYDDFDTMWLKINKLVTLLYPQWSRGKQLKVGESTFIQPFSQVPTSSPVVRMRLGDLFRSNYSKFGLARLFGLGEDDFTIDGVSPSKDASDVEKFLETSNSIKDRMRQIPTTEAELSTKGFFAQERALLKPFNAPLQTGPTVPVVGPPKPTIRQSTQVLNVQITKSNLRPMNSGHAIPVYELTILETDSQGNQQLPPGISSGPYVVPFDQLIADEKFISQLASQSVFGTDDPTKKLSSDEATVSRFFDGENNSIVRSFESVAGRGLAGVITTMGFDWKAPTWDTTDIGRRAPQWCLVTLTFSPIHDIAPGLDAHGFNRAPVYNVGREANKLGRDPYNDNANARLFKTNHSRIARNRKPKG